MMCSFIGAAPCKRKFRFAFPLPLPPPRGNTRRRCEIGNDLGRPAAFPAFACREVSPAFSASSCCPAVRLTLAPRPATVSRRTLSAVFPAVCLFRPRHGPSRGFLLSRRAAWAVRRSGLWHMPCRGVRGAGAAGTLGRSPCSLGLPRRP